MRDGFLSSSPGRMESVLMLRGIGIIELGERSIRKFFEHRMSTYGAALAYRGLFGLFPFVLIVVVLVGVLGLPDFLDRMIEQAQSQSSQPVPQRLEPVVEQGREQLQPFARMIEQAQKQAGGELLIFGVAVALWSTSALARTLTEAFNIAYEISETRPGWKRAALAVVLWTISSVGFSFYLENFANYGVTYGSLGAAVGLLLYLYLSASVVLLGAEVNAAIYHLPPDGSVRAEKPGSDHETKDTRAGG